MLPALGDLKVGTSGRDATEIRLLALIIVRGANQQARRCNDVVQRVIKHVVDLDVHQDNHCCRDLSSGSDRRQGRSSGTDRRIWQPSLLTHRLHCSGLSFFCTALQGGGKLSQPGFCTIIREIKAKVMPQHLLVRSECGRHDVVDQGQHLTQLSAEVEERGSGSGECSSPQTGWKAPSRCRQANGFSIAPAQR